MTFWPCFLLGYINGGVVEMQRYKKDAVPFIFLLPMSSVGNESWQSCKLLSNNVFCLIIGLRKQTSEHRILCLLHPSHFTQASHIHLKASWQEEYLDCFLRNYMGIWKIFFLIQWNYFYLLLWPIPYWSI